LFLIDDCRLKALLIADCQLTIERTIEPQIIDFISTEASNVISIDNQQSSIFNLQSSIP